jgi:hypothetical protein
MLFKVLCNKCKKNLKIRKVYKEDLSFVLVVDSCNTPGCLLPHQPDNESDFKKYLSDMFHIESSDSFTIDFK